MPMIIEPATFNPDLSDSSAYMEETFHLLHDGLGEFLNNKEAVYEDSVIDYLEILMTKINYTQTHIDDDDDREQLEALRAEVSQMILTDFNKLFGLDITPQEFRLNLVFNIFYINRAKYLIEALTEYIFRNRKDIANKYKVSSKKDLIYNRLKTELPDIKNSLYVYIIMCYQEIIDDILTSNSIVIEDFLIAIPLTHEQYLALESYFEGQHQLEMFNKLTAGLVNSHNFNHFILKCRDELITKLTNIT